MTEVQLSPNDRDDILQLLDYALEKKLEEPPERQGRYSFNYSGYWKERIPQLKRLICGKKNFSLYQSSLGGLIRDIKEGLEDDDSIKERNI